MALREWLRPPRRLIALFLLVTLVPSTALVVVGWRLLEQDRVLSINQLSERREQAADLAVLELEHVVDGAEQALESPQSLAAIVSERDAVGVIFERETVRTLPGERLVFYPRTEAGAEAPAQRFAEGEDLEFRQQDWGRATRIYRSLGRSPAADVRAGALIRLARLLRKSDHEEALEMYEKLSRVSGVSVGGVPADLLARWARCVLLETLHRDRELQDEARALRLDLEHGRWRLDRATYELHADDVRRWAPVESSVEGSESRLALAFAVEMLWNDWRSQALDRRSGSGRRVIDTPTGPITVVSAGTGEQLSALLATREHIETHWLAKIAPVLDRQRLMLALRDSSVRGASGSEARRAAADTGLPWTVVVREVDPQGELARIAGRRTIWLWGLMLLISVTAGGLVIITRSVMRDLAVARLQSSFVSAVSHEFRTPLTSLRQLTEVLLDGRVADEDRRDAYYRALDRQTDRLHRLVESLLDFGRMEAGISPYRLEPLVAVAFIQSVVDEFEHDGAARGCHLALQLDGLQGTSPMVAADREALSHALWNLLDNAVKYSLECRTVWVDVERAGSRLAIRVRDRGLGVPRREQVDIFKRFVRGAGAQAHGVQGTGIGLAMVQHIVMAHGGAVELDSEEGVGSTFSIVLPVVEPCLAS